MGKNWNIQTTYWLRHVVYERAPKKYATALTFGLSAVWHGFFIGYYFLFSFAHFITLAHRKIQKQLNISTPKILDIFVYNMIFNYAGMGIKLLLKQEKKPTAKND